MQMGLKSAAFYHTLNLICLVQIWAVAASYLPADSLNTRETDAPFSVSASTLGTSITCPRGIYGAKGGVVLLVHGTASSANESWGAGPYNLYLPYAGPGFDVCWVELPDHALGDAQVTAEYVAYNIPILAKQSATQQVALIGHSQGGGLTIQWALDFWPSTRNYVSDYVALAGDFHGTSEGMFACLGPKLLAKGCPLSLLQQTTGSNYLKAQNKRGGNALVSTTSIYTRYDDLIQDEIINPTSILPGATNIALQDVNVCGPLQIVEHFTMLIDPAAYFLALDALTHNGTASLSRFDQKYCNEFKNQTALDFRNAADVAEAVATALWRIFSPLNPAGPRAYTEPPLKQYVCDQGQATSCGAS